MKKYKKDFSNKDFADHYIKKHKKLLEKLGYEYAEKLSSLRFEKGKFLILAADLEEWILP
jgi:hypothetical protein